MATSVPKNLKEIEIQVSHKLKLVVKANSDSYEIQQTYYDEILKIYREAFTNMINNTITFSKILHEIKIAYEDALQIRDKRIIQYITQDKVFGVSVRKNQRDDKMKKLMKENDELKGHNLKLNFEISKLKKDIGKVKDEKFSDYLALMRERDARYTLYFENLGLQMKLKELDGSYYPVDLAYGDPVVLRIALDKCREQLSTTQRSLARVTEEYADTVPRREYDALEAKHCDANNALDSARTELKALQETCDKLLVKKKSLEEELSEVKERCRELERAGTPRPQWEICADFIGGGRDRWWQLASGLSSRDILRVLLKELGPAAESEHLEYFDGLGTDVSVPPYLRHAGRVRNLRLSRREVAVVVADIWRGKEHCKDMNMQDYVTEYFENRYQQASVRAEWAYNVCAGASQMLEEPQVRVFWGALTGALDQRLYWGLREHWGRLRAALYSRAGGTETVTIEDFEKAVRATFPLKSEVDIKNLSDVVRKQLKLRLNQNEINLDKLFHESEEGFDRSELSRELHRQRRAAQARYVRELLAALAPRAPVSVAALQRAFAIVDPAIDHIRMERYVRWAFGAETSQAQAQAQAGDVPPAPLRRLAARLAAGDIERVGARTRRGPTRHYSTHH